MGFGSGENRKVVIYRRMDFLQIVAVYVILFFASVGFYFKRDAPILQQGLFGKLRSLIILVFQTFVPKRFLEIVYNATYYILYTRNQFMKLLFFVLVISGNLICILDMLPILLKYEPEENHIIIPMIIAFINFYFFHKSCNGDPGEINPSNLEMYNAVYEYDNKLYIPNTKCRTCQFVKPARSKHCSICNRCVHRFDHHCIWTNNDVGGLNHHYFVLFLLTMTFKCTYGCYQGIKCLVLYTRHNKLLEATVVTSSGEAKQVTVSILLQHLFLQFPRLVFVVTSLFFLIILLGVFTVYHVNVVLTNRTTNERYKTAELEPIKTDDTDRHSKKKSRSKECLPDSFIYDRGIIGNIYDVFWQQSIVKGVKLK